MIKAWIIVTCLIFPVFFIAADPPPVGVGSPGWIEWSMKLGESAPPRNSGLDQREFSALLETIQNIGMLFRKLPILNPPQGVEVSPNRTIFHRVGIKTAHRQGIKSTDTSTPSLHPLKTWPPPGKRGDEGKGPVRGELFIGIYRPVFSYRNPRCTVRVQINDPWLEGRIIFEDTEGGIYLPWPHAEEQRGRLRYQIDRNTVIEKILPEGRDPWIPVSQERWIRALIGKSEENLEKQRSDIVDGSAERRKKFMQGYERMKSLNSEQAEKMLETFETNEEIYEKQAAAIAAEDYDALEAAGQRGLAMVGRHLQTLKEELSGMSTAEREAPAYGFEENPAMYWMPRRKPKRPSLLLEAGDPKAFPLQAPDPMFFRSDLPATAVQSLTIINKLWKEYDDAMNKDFDWTALRKMVE